MAGVGTTRRSRDGPRNRQQWDRGNTGMNDQRKGKLQREDIGQTMLADRSTARVAVIARVAPDKYSGVPEDSWRRPWANPARRRHCPGTCDNCWKLLGSQIGRPVKDDSGLASCTRGHLLMRFTAAQ
jgi:hypothetical protein